MKYYSSRRVFGRDTETYILEPNETKEEVSKRLDESLSKTFGGGSYYFSKDGNNIYVTVTTYTD